MKKEQLKGLARTFDKGLEGDIIAYRPDPYGRLRQALADGKVVQRRRGDSLEWVDCLPPMRWNLSPDEYRVKPEPQWAMLGKTDIPPGSVLCPSGFYDNGRWFSIRAVLSDGILTDGAENDDDSKHITFESLLRDRWQINRPRHRDADGNPTLWEPCRKLSNETPETKHHDVVAERQEMDAEQDIGFVTFANPANKTRGWFVNSRPGKTKPGNTTEHDNTPVSVTVCDRSCVPVTNNTNSK